MNNKIKNFALIIGAMKCGTTSLYNYLVQHPEISACKDKEPGYFSSNRRFARGLDYYSTLWDWNPNVHKIALEASTLYTSIYPDSLKFANTITAKNIAQYQAATNSNFKFIYIIRNPLERICSHYNHILAMPGGNNLLKSMGKNVNNYMINTSRYGMQISEFYTKFDSKNILLLDFDELKNDPFNLITKVCNFLGVDPEYKFQELNIKHNHHTQKKNILLPGYYLIRNTELMKSILTKVPEKVRHYFLNLLGSTVQIDYYKLSPEEQNYFLRELHDDLQKLNLQYGFDTSHWNSKI